MQKDNEKASEPLSLASPIVSKYEKLGGCEYTLTLGFVNSETLQVTRYDLDLPLYFQTPVIT
ncbi:hypothetical protein GD428_04645 [Escherichia coli]|uniref:hypothetical protein n=1 Tax=Escherichia coli TaxID=562 RepID=UPI0018C4FFDD|nr:hypothetical protein [Escherichia coli]MBF8842961.1 hypothetical protein [Escherichia coli]MBY8801867.1 hypothetical protein [Escherichia coli]MCK2613204.1 hypothetical protein [Escherichia coli]MCK2631865.1 hypothetical protein [Escherichia coli]WLY43181.1 hypothetical protein RA171_18210 [Escherichia coli]